MERNLQVIGRGSSAHSASSIVEQRADTLLRRITYCPLLQQTTGDRLMDRIEYEEWALKAIDPTLSPKPWSLRNGTENREKSDKEKVRLCLSLALLSRALLCLFMSIITNAGACRGVAGHTGVPRVSLEA